MKLLIEKHNKLEYKSSWDRRISQPLPSSQAAKTSHMLPLTPVCCRSAGLVVTSVASKQYKGSLRQSSMQARLKTQHAKGVAQCKAEGSEWN